MKIWFISDTHFYHLNCYLSYEPEREREMAAENGYNPRSEDELDEFFMADEDNAKQTLNAFDDLMVKRWNKVVGKNDMVWFLGDLSFTSKANTAALCRRLNGIKYMIRGNHDNFSDEFYRKECGFVEVNNHPILWEGQFILSHEPVISPYFNIFGHIHNMFDPIHQTDLCVCACRNNYYPFDFNDYFFFDTEEEMWKRKGKK